MTNEQSTIRAIACQLDSESLRTLALAACLVPPHELPAWRAKVLRELSQLCGRKRKREVSHRRCERCGDQLEVDPSDEEYLCDRCAHFGDDLMPNRPNLDATRGRGYWAREEGRFGSHPSHDRFDGDSDP